MKVEFQHNNIFGDILVIKESDFRDAKKNEKEFLSLCLASQAYAASLNMEYTFDINQLAYINDRLEKGGSVIFSIQQDDINNCYFMKILVSNNGVPETVLINNGNRTRVYAKPISESERDKK